MYDSLTILRVVHFEIIKEYTTYYIDLNSKSFGQILLNYLSCYHLHMIWKGFLWFSIFRIHVFLSYSKLFKLFQVGDFH